jgi:hypothetical protein
MKIRIVEETNTLTGKKMYNVYSKDTSFISSWYNYYYSEDKEQAEKEYERLKNIYAKKEIKILKEEIV